jgi:hypothetical protein
LVGATYLPFAPIELISAHPWRRVVFTTYALSLSFFEAVVLDALVRAGGREMLIFADVEGVSMALREQGARRVGKEYDVEPIAVRNGVFHPKLSVMIAEDECHILVGSGNLTFGGWGGNLEVIEHLHPSFAVDAIEDVAGFFEQLASTDNVSVGAADRCPAIAGDLRGFSRGRTRNGDIRFFHNLDGSISQKLAQVVEDLGGAVRISVASPFWDRGSAIDNLCSAMGLREVSVHSHVGGTVEGTTGSNWPMNAVSTVRPVRLDVMNEEKPRRLHAKVFEVLCKRGRVLLSGSPNATGAALGPHRNVVPGVVRVPRRNVEACVARIQREPVLGWRYSPSEVPDLVVRPDDDDKENLEAPGVLRGVLKGDQIIGQVLTPQMSGMIFVSQLTTEGAEILGEATLAQDATFSLAAPILEVQSWKYGRLVLQVRSNDGRRAEGFVSVVAFAEIARRAGAMAPRLFSLLSGTETPADVAAILSWFHDDPRRLAGATPMKIAGHLEVKGFGSADQMIAINELGSSFAAAKKEGTETGAGASWRRFMEHVFAAFRNRRGPFEDDGDGDDDDENGNSKKPQKQRKPDPAVARTLETFDKLFELLISTENIERNGIIAYDLTQYICERLKPDVDRAKTWFERLISAILHVTVPADRREEVAASILVWLASSYDLERARQARAWLLRVGFSVNGAVPSTELAQGFKSVFIPTMELSEAWARVQKVRTYSEQIRSYLLALKSGKPSTEYEDLRNAAPDEWPSLQDALSSPGSRSRICVLDKWSKACPHCHMTLPAIEVSKLRNIGIATAVNCCRRTLLHPGA